MAYLVTHAKRELVSSSPKEPQKIQSNHSSKKLTSLTIFFFSINALSPHQIEAHVIWGLYMDCEKNDTLWWAGSNDLNQTIKF